MRISDPRIRYLGHILRHPGSLESLIIFNNSFSLPTISSPFRRGAPRAHWPELALTEAIHRTTVLSQGASLFGQYPHEFYQFFTTVELKNFSHTSMTNWYDTTHSLKILLPIAENREHWSVLSPKLK